MLGNAVTVDLYIPLIQPQQPHNNLDGGGLSGTVWAKEAEYLPGVNLHADVMQDLPLAEIFIQMVNFQCNLHYASPPSPETMTVLPFSQPRLSR